VITTGAGNPGKHIPLLKEKGIKVIPVSFFRGFSQKNGKTGASTRSLRKGWNAAVMWAN
jgi:hypothetical protein